MKKVAIIGTQGLPAKYGGFETLVANIICKKKYSDIQYTVFCSSKDFDIKLTHYKDALLEYIPLHANGIQSIPYDILSILRAVRNNKILLILGVSGCIILPLVKIFYRGKIIVNIDGIEYKRAKWGKLAKFFLYISERVAVKIADTIIADNKGIKDYIWSRYAKKAELIAYGGDHVILDDIERNEYKDILNQYSLNANDYSISICRIEPENNCHIILEAFAQSGQRLVFIGNWDKCEYSRGLKKKYVCYENISILSSVYDLKILHVLRKKTRFYIHGHSAGGTNPSLVEAMFFGVPVLAFDVIYNKITTEYKAHYFNSKDELLSLINNLGDTELIENSIAMKNIANERYKWSEIAKLYEQLY